MGLYSCERATVVSHSSSTAEASSRFTNPSRRSFLAGSAGAAGLFGLSVGMADSATAASMPAVTSTDLISNFSLVTTPEWHLARRACPGSNKAIADEIAAKGISAWLDEQINYTRIDDSVYEAEREKFFPFYGMAGTELEKKPFAYTEVYHGYLGRATFHEQWRSKRQLKASLTNFFADQLSFSAVKVIRSGACMSVNAIRNNALGKYRDMLKAMEYSLGMNDFLDNIGNTKNFPNQNLGRELLELHTLGVGNHTQEDVLNVTTILTGMVATTGYTMTFDPNQHQNGTVRVGSWSNANVGGSAAACSATLNSLIDYLAMHPATAKRLATRLAIHYVSDNPPAALVDRLANIYLKNDTAIGPVVKTLFTSPEFNASVGQKIRRPQSIAASIMATSQRVPNEANMLPYGTGPGQGRGNSFAEIDRLIAQAGHAPYSRTFPDGFPLENRQWMTGTSLLALINMEQLAFFRSSEITAPDWNKVFNLSKTERYNVSVPKAILYGTGFTVTDKNIWRPISAAWSSDVGSIPTVFGIGPSSRTAFIASSIFASPMFLLS